MTTNMNPSHSLFGQKSERLLLWVFYFFSFCIFLITSITIFLFPANWFLLLFLGVLAWLMLLSAVILFFYLSYRAHPTVIDKNLRKAALANANSALQAINRTIHEIKQEENNALEKLKNEIRNSEVQLNSFTNQTQLEISRNRSELENALASRLNSVRNQIFNASLHAQFVEKAEIHGIGPVLVERMKSAGVITAADITSLSLSNVPGIGQTKESELLNWRLKVETQIRHLLPDRLPEQEELLVREPYKAKKAALEEKLITTRQAHNSLSEKINQQINATSAHYEERINTYHQEAEGAKSKVEETKNAFSLVRYASFGRYLRESLRFKLLSKSIPIIAMFPNALMLVTCCLCLTIMATGSSGVGIVESWPTKTNTPSITCTMTNTLTPTETLIPSSTLSPTWTLTPSLTRTFTITYTPTRTWTSSATPTLTKTPSRTPTLTNTRAPTNTYLPIPTQGPMVRCGAICRDGTRSSATGSGACSHHGGVSQWLLCPS